MSLYGPQLRPLDRGRVSVRLASSAETSTLARRACRPLFPFVGGRADDLALVLSELVANGVRHPDVDGRGEVTIEAWAYPRHVRLEVGDMGSRFPLPDLPEQGADLDGGWGLFLVDSLSDRWGLTDKPTTEVWVEMARKPLSPGTGKAALRRAEVGEYAEAVENLDKALVDQDRLSDRYEACRETTTELGAYMRLRDAGERVAAAEAWLKWLERDD